MPEDYGNTQGYGGYPQQPMQQGSPSPQMPAQQPYGYGQPPMGANQYGYPGGQPPKQGLGVGAIIGIVIGTLFLLFILGFFVLGSALVGSRDDAAGDDVVTTRPVEGENGGDSDDGTLTIDTEGEGDGDGTTPDSQGTEVAPVTSGDTQSDTPVDVNNLSDDWTLMEVNLAGKGYRLFESTYGDLIAGGWMLDEYSMQKISQNGGSLILNAGDWTTFSFSNPAYPDQWLTVGLGNLGDAPINYDQATLVYLSSRVPTSDGHSAYDQTYAFVVSKGATFGLTDAEILAKFGEPSDDGSIYEDAESGFKTITYTVIGEGEAFNRNYYTLEFQFHRDDDGQYRVMSMTIGA